MRRAAAVACDAARQYLPGVVQAVHRPVHAPPPRELWTLSAADENMILYRFLTVLVNVCDFVSMWVVRVRVLEVHKFT